MNLKYFGILFTVLAAFAVGVFFATHPGFNQSGASASARSIAWKSVSFQTSLEEAKTSHRPLFVDFYADWCTYCKAMEKVYSNPEIVRLSNRFVCAKVDVDKYPDIAQNFRVGGLPTLIFFEPSRHETKRLEGYVNSAQLADIMLQMAR